MACMISYFTVQGSKPGEIVRETTTLFKSMTPANSSGVVEIVRFDMLRFEDHCSSKVITEKFDKNGVRYDNDVSQ